MRTTKNQMNNTLKSLINAIRALFGYPPMLRVLKATYTVEDRDMLSVQYGLNLEDELASTLAEEIRREVDSDLLHILGMMGGVQARLRVKYNRQSIFSTARVAKRSRFAKMHGVSFGRFRPKPHRWIAY